MGTQLRIMEEQVPTEFAPHQLAQECVARGSGIRIRQCCYYLSRAYLAKAQVGREPAGAGAARIVPRLSVGRECLIDESAQASSGGRFTRPPCSGKARGKFRRA